MINRDSSVIEVGDKEVGKAKRTASLRDVELKDALKRILGEGGSEDMFKMVHEASKKGGRLSRKWYKDPTLGLILSSTPSSAVLIKIFFFS